MIDQNQKSNPIVRKALLSATLDPPLSVRQVECRQIDFHPGQPTGLHRHPCPVFGVVMSGTIYFQVEGEPPKTLHAGDAYHEPAGSKMLRFDAGDGPARFIGFYLLSDAQQPLIEMLT